MLDLNSERRFLDSLGRILVTNRDSARAVEYLSRTSAGSEEMVAVARKHKVLTILFNNLERLKLEGSLAMQTERTEKLFKMAEQEVGLAFKTRALLQKQLLDLIDGVSGRIGEPIIVLKGFSNARFYPPPYVRWMRDIDLYCASWTDAHVVYCSLSERSFDFDKDENFWIKSFERKIALYGQIFMRKEFENLSCRFDIHFSTFSVSYHSFLDIEMGALTEEFEIGQHPLQGLNANGCILLTLAHMLSDGYVSAKDINDFVAVTLATKPDWEWLEKQIAHNQLAPQARRLAQHVRSLYDHPNVDEACSELLWRIGSSHKPSLWQTHNRSWSLRASVNAVYTFGIECSRSGPGSGLWQSILCFLYYVRRLKVSYRERDMRERILLKLMPKPSLGEGKLFPNTCIILIPARGAVNLEADFPREPSLTESQLKSHEIGNVLTSSRLAEDLEYIRLDGFEFVSSMEHIFLPTLDLIIPPQQVNTIEHLKGILQGLK